jgi:hypothetical protein
MTVDQRPPPWRTGLEAELATAETHLARADTKAEVLLTLTGAGATAGLAVLPAAHLPLSATVAGYVAVALLVAAAGILAVAVRPELSAGPGRRVYGVAYYATLTAQTADDVLNEVDAGRRSTALADRLVALSALAVGKYRRIRLAVDVMLAGLVVAVVASVLVGVG